MSGSKQKQKHEQKPEQNPEPKPEQSSEPKEREEQMEEEMAELQPSGFDACLAFFILFYNLIVTICLAIWRLVPELESIAPHPIEENGNISDAESVTSVSKSVGSRAKRIFKEILPSRGSSFRSSRSSTSKKSKKT